MLTPLAGLALLSNTWFVDAGGGGDFTDLPGAVAASTAGDVLLVQPGVYSAFTMDEELTILGPAAGPLPQVLGESRVEGVGRFAIAGLAIERLVVRDVAGHGTIDECSLRFSGAPSVELFDCDRVQIERSDLDGGLLVERSTLAVVESKLRGFDATAGAGGSGLRAVDSDLQIVKTDLEGGAGASGANCGPGGAALDCVGSSVLFLGNDHLAVGGGGGGGCPPGPAVSASADAVVDHQGIALFGVTDPSSGATIFEGFGYPLMTLIGSDLPGQTRRLQISAVHFNYIFAMGSLLPASTTVPGIQGLLGIDPNAIFFTQVEIGQLLVAPVTIAFTVPQDLLPVAGTIVHFQALVSLIPGVIALDQLALTNPVSLLLRF